MAYCTAGKRVLITGASSGVGAALARQLAAGGAVVGLLAERADRLEEVLAACQRSSPASAMWVADLADTAAVGQLAVQASDALGGIDILVNNAAMVKLIEPGPVDTDIWDQPGNEDPLYRGPKVSADEVAEGIITTLVSDRFEHYLPDMKSVVDAKNADLDGYIAGPAAMASP
jgi:NAD(P)-dependent dehydrogenase (short-subunit alcohol dehydrogenase family)